MRRQYESGKPAWQRESAHAIQITYMSRRLCPRCRSLEVRRLGVESVGVAVRVILLYPFRCEGCKHRFLRFTCMGASPFYRSTWLTAVSSLDGSHPGLTGGKRACPATHTLSIVCPLAAGCRAPSGQNMWWGPNLVGLGLLLLCRFSLPNIGGCCQATGQVRFSH